MRIRVSAIILVASSFVAPSTGSDFDPEPPQWLAGSHINFEPYLERATLSVTEVLEPSLTREDLLLGVGTLSFENVGTEITVSTLDVMKSLAGWGRSGDRCIDALLPFLNRDVDLNAIPLEARMWVYLHVKGLVSEGRFFAEDRFREKPLVSYLRVTYVHGERPLQTVGRLFLREDGIIFFHEPVWGGGCGGEVHFPEPVLEGEFVLDSYGQVEGLADLPLEPIPLPIDGLTNLHTKPLEVIPNGLPQF